MLLREYQVRNKEDVRSAYREGFRKPLLVSPTGSGKTVLFCDIAKGAAERRLRVLILTHRSELMDQISATLTAGGAPHALLSAGRTMPGGYSLMVASVQTLYRRLQGSPLPDLVVVDEAHHTAASQWMAIFAHYKQARFLGVTATPERLDGRGLGDFYDTIVMGPTVRWLIDNGHLAPPRYFAAIGSVDASGLKKVGGDFSRKEASELVDRPIITGDAIHHYRKFANGQTAIAFTVSISHAESVCAQFNSAGIPSAVIDGSMSPTQRKSIIRRLREREILVLVSVDLISEGFDLPAVTAAILLRPTASLSMHLQQVGRVLRPAPGKECALIIDHVGNCVRHGLAEEERDWSLDGGSTKRRKKEFILETRQCATCYCIYGGTTCPECGTTRESRVRQIEQQEGMLAEIEAIRLVKAREMKQQVREARTLQDLIAIGKARGYETRWAFVQWKMSWRSKLPAARRVSPQPTLSGIE